MNFLEFLKNNTVILDGGMGTLLQSRGLAPGESPERWNLTHPEVITEIHKEYYNSGTNLVCANTFGANVLKFSPTELEQIIAAAIKNARTAAAQSYGKQEKFVALDLGPTGKLLAPLGDLDFEDAVGIFSATVKLGVKYGVDAIFIETMNDSYETKAALLAAKECCSLPVIVTNAYGSDCKLMTGASPSAMAVMLESMGADMIGANCSLGPKELCPVIEELLSVSSVPIAVKPNAGLPKVVDGVTVYDVSPDDFVNELAALHKLGVRAVGGCCGTTPDYIKPLAEALSHKKPIPVAKKKLTAVSSYTHTVTFGEVPVLIGERINPTGKKRFKAALLEGDMDYILNEGVTQENKGAAILDVNVGLPEIDEVKMLTRAVCELQTVTNLPLQIDTANPEAMESALRRYNGKALVNSVSGKEESMRAVFPLVKKYGGTVIALTLDDNGIPDSAEGRVEIAKRIISVAKEYGIDKRDLVFDTLAMTVSADKNAARVTLSALKTIKEELGCHTSLGVSNVSFGLPHRDGINAAFFAMALADGLSAAIMNPYSAEMMRTYYSYCALMGLDDNCAQYIKNAESLLPLQQTSTPLSSASPEGKTELSNAIIKGFKERAKALSKELLVNTPPLVLVNEHIIPALNEVGRGFEEKRVYLPSLLMSAEAAKWAFESVKEKMSEAADRTAAKSTVVIATVHGDIHDIGKNIVKLLLENYGYDVIDLGKDVPPEIVVEKTLESGAKIVGLSALMTTTVPAMAETIRQLRLCAPDVKVVVGGAVLNKDYAMQIGADKYAADAMETVRYCEETLI